MSDETAVSDSTKKPWESKTIIANSVGLLAMAIAPFLPAAAGVQPWIAAHGESIALFWTLLNLVLRSVTKDKIVLKD